MLTVGVDLAAEPRNTAVARIAWTPEGGEVVDLVVGADDGQILEAVGAADKAGIDCPLGWPVPFVEFIAAHHAGGLVTPAEMAGKDWRRTLAYRRTDLVVHRRTGLLPLSVATDRIAHPAMRCASLLAELANRGSPADRAGAGVVVEVYPAASLHHWGLRHRGYKGTGNAALLDGLVADLCAAAPWLSLGGYGSACRTSDHATDAVVAALTARAAALRRATRPDPEHALLAGTEGWIALPTCPLADLVAPAG
jgi:predicted nuclease with RNAse H fold